MPNTKSALKAMRVAERRRARNKPIRSGTRTRVRQAEHEIAAGNAQEARALVIQAVSALDKAAQKGIIHPNNASRNKSRLMRKLSQLAVQAAQVAAKEAPPTRPKRAAATKPARATRAAAPRAQPPKEAPATRPKRAAATKPARATRAAEPKAQPPAGATSTRRTARPKKATEAES